MSEALRYRQLEQGAEYLAETCASRAERIEHLKLAALYGRRAREAGAEACAATRH